MESARDRIVAYRRSLPRAPRLERRALRVRGLELAVFTTSPVPAAAHAPPAPPLLCINGGMIYGHELLWPALAPLAAGRQIVLYDQRGRGRSQVPPGARAARIEHDAGDVRAIREALGVERWDVLGHSWGGGIAMLAVAADREATRRLVLVDPVGLTSEWIPSLQRAALDRLRDAGASGPLADARDALARFDDALLATDDPEVQSDWARALYPAWFADRGAATMYAPARVTSRTGSAVVARLRRDGYDWRGAVCGLPTPALIIHGDEDLLPVAMARETTDCLPNARLALVPDAGHMPFLEAPDRFFPLVESFLSDAAEPLSPPSPARAPLPPSSSSSA
ncbi:MAG TPA: alpha/beta fold hydrolase [Gemmatimonadaceae bacterium]|nr:alpha/beta fold hydrolase [Gemmatimonadaceae bacterium]